MNTDYKAMAQTIVNTREIIKIKRKEGALAEIKTSDYELVMSILAKAVEVIGMESLL